MASSRMLYALAAGFGAVWLASAAPAQAAGNTVHDAHHACRELMWDKGYKGIDTGDTDRRRGHVVTEVQGRRHGDSHDVDCVYDTKTDKAHLRRN